MLCNIQKGKQQKMQLQSQEQQMRLQRVRESRV